MSVHFLPRLAPVVLALASVPAAAQSAATPALTPGAGEGFVRTTPLENYKPFIDENLIPWREANDTVGRIGGWREYAREARPPEPTPSTPPTQPRSGSDHSHGSH
jgi:hypothetical protein